MEVKNIYPLPDNSEGCQANTPWSVKQIFMNFCRLLKRQFCKHLGMTAQEAFTITALTVSAWVALYMVITIVYALRS